MQLAFKRWPAQTNEQGRLVFLHGMGGTGALWRPIAASLEERYSILAPDQRGHGGSRSSVVAGTEYTPLDYGRDVVELIEREQFTDCWLVGHSMGVRTACAAVHLKPNYFKGMILIDLGFSGPAGGGLGEGLASFLRILPMHFATRNDARAFMQSNCPDPSIAQYLMAVSVSDAHGAVTFPFDRGALIETIHAARDISVRAWIEEAGTRKLPVLVLRGERSLVWTAEEFAREQAALAAYPSIRFETVAGATHGLPFEKRLEFVARLQAWITEPR